MANILICCTPAHGHVYPLLTVAKHLVETGHDVRMLTGRAYADAVRAAGVEFVAMPAEADIDLDHANHLFPERAAMRPIPQLRFSVIECFIKPSLPQVRAIDDAIATRRVDVILTEMMFLGSAALVRRPRSTRPPVVTLGIFPLAATDPDVAPYGLGITPLPGPVGRLRNRMLAVIARRLFAPVVVEARQRFRELGATIPKDFDMFDLPSHTDLMLQFTVSGFEYPRSTLPANVRFIGPMTRTAPSTTPLPAWWDELDDARPVVHVTQGTVANSDFRDLVIPAMAGLSDDDVLVVVSTGGRPVQALGPLPANVRAAEYLPYGLLFPRLSAFVTNGGYGGLQFALQHGVPIVAAGTSEDKLETNARVRWSKAGISLRSNRPAPKKIARAVRDVMRDPGYRAAAARLSAEIATSPGLAGVDRAISDLVPSRST